MLKLRGPATTLIEGETGTDKSSRPIDAPKEHVCPRTACRLRLRLELPDPFSPPRNTLESPDEPNNHAADRPGEAVLKRAGAEQSPPPGGLLEEEPEYEVIDLICERIGTLLFPCPLRIVELGGRAPEPPVPDPKR
jgi:hypothetical protein